MSSGVDGTSLQHAPMNTYAPVDATLAARAVAYIFDGEYSCKYTPEVPLEAVVLCIDPSAPQTVGEILTSLPPLVHLRYFAFHNGIVAYNGMLPPTFFAELLGYIFLERGEGTMTERIPTKELLQQIRLALRERRTFQERFEELEEVVDEVLHLMNELEPGMSVSAEWIAERKRLAKQITKLKALHGAEKLQETTEEDM